jgi:hypothetical protein
MTADADRVADGSAVVSAKLTRGDVAGTTDGLENVQWQQAAVRMGGGFQGQAHGSAAVTCCPIAWSRWLRCSAPW